MLFFFQATDADAEAFEKELDILHRSLHGKVYDMNREYLSLDNVDFGGKFLLESEAY